MSSTNEFFCRNAARRFRILCGKDEDDGVWAVDTCIVVVVVVVVIVVSDAFLLVAGGFSSYVSSELPPEDTSCLIAEPSIIPSASSSSPIALVCSLTFIGARLKFHGLVRGPFWSTDAPLPENGGPNEIFEEYVIKKVKKNTQDTGTGCRSEGMA